MNNNSPFKKLPIAVAIIALHAGSANAAVELMDGKLKIGGAVMQGWQGPIELEGSGRVTGADDDGGSGFHRLRYALTIDAQVTDDISVFAELAEEPNDFNTDAGFDQFGIAQDLAWIQADLGNGTLVRLGNIITTAMPFLRYSDGAAVQSNPFIGNTPVDMITAEQGIWALGSSELAGGNSITWDVGVSTPDFLTDTTDQGKYNYQGRGTFNFDNGLSFGAGVVKTTGDLTCSGGVCVRDDGAAFNSLIGLGDGDNYQFATRGPSQVNHVAIVPGVDALIYQLDVQYKTDVVMAHAFYGQAEDDFSWADQGGGYRPLTATFSDEDAEMSYWGVEGQFYVTPKIYLASRYTLSENETGSVSSDNELTRLQVAAGYWYADNVLIKAEYVTQEEDALSGGQNVDGTGSAEWDGVLLEASVSW
ncbi:hypothetical protein [Marinobacter sp.]|jgi:hypothetical protein|uniref:hypothetical protein n=1 Tax=Marinobacter sp. TaxID=50741 RepID=UPI003B518DFB